MSAYLGIQENRRANAATELEKQKLAQRKKEHQLDLALRQDQLAENARQADQSADVAIKGQNKNFTVGMGNIGLGYYGANQTHHRGLMQLGLNQQSINNQFTLGMRNADIAQQNADTGFYSAQTGRQNAGINLLSVLNQDSQFDKTHALNQKKHQDNVLIDAYGLLQQDERIDNQDEQFYYGQEQQAEQFGQSLALDRDQLAQQGSQFERSAEQEDQRISMLRKRLKLDEQMNSAQIQSLHEDIRLTRTQNRKLRAEYKRERQQDKGDINFGNIMEVINTSHGSPQERAAAIKDAVEKNSAHLSEDQWLSVTEETKKLFPTIGTDADSMEAREDYWGEAFILAGQGNGDTAKPYIAFATGGAFSEEDIVNVRRIKDEDPEKNLLIYDVVIDGKLHKDQTVSEAEVGDNTSGRMQRMMVREKGQTYWNVTQANLKSRTEIENLRARIGKSEAVLKHVTATVDHEELVGYEDLMDDVLGWSGKSADDTDAAWEVLSMAKALSETNGKSVRSNLIQYATVNQLIAQGRTDDADELMQEMGLNELTQGKGALQLESEEKPVEVSSWDDVKGYKVGEKFIYQGKIIEVTEAILERANQ
jgi:hypothetical protein